MSGFGASKTGSALGTCAEGKESEVELADGIEQVGVAWRRPAGERDNEAATRGTGAKAIVARSADLLANASCESETSYELALACPVFGPKVPTYHFL